MSGVSLTGGLVGKGANIKNGSFDPATLALTGWWRASYGGSPWNGTASAGTSGANNLSEATNPPSNGAAINGLTPADFDGTNDQLGGGAFTTYYDVDGYSGWALVNVDAISTDNASTFLNDAILSDTGGIGEVYLRDNGAGTVIVGLAHYNGATQGIVTATFTTSAWKLVQWKYDGTNVKIRVDSGAWQSSSAGGDLDTTGANLRVGASYNAGQFLDGRVAEIGLADLVISDTDFDNVKSYVNSRYALSL